MLPNRGALLLDRSGLLLLVGPSVDLQPHPFLQRAALRLHPALHRFRLPGLEQQALNRGEADKGRPKQNPFEEAAAQRGEGRRIEQKRGLIPAAE